ncbi:hypothetical protein B6U79_01425 [Candidatus Bathyarchaeota archaeon ex4484_231]|nr:MAG: hypothetical protein B6U79_01425 [Candidatus Bathyarchaeota archaeon ex4484_231]RJS76331.1 MAG: hypothetical protein CW712_02105 [Candidatus Bathyarchaeota archaeon]
MSERAISDRLEEVSKKLDAIMRRLDLLETMVIEKPEYADVASSLRLLRLGIRLYDEPVKILSRLKLAERYVKHSKIRKDEISRCIVQALALKGPLNTSAITREVKAMRGTASRRIVRQRLQKLEKDGVVRLVEGFGTTYELVEQ